MAKLGSGFDIVSGGELQRIIRAGGKLEKTIFSGVGKSEEEIRLALEHGIFSLNLESDAELTRIHEIANDLGVTAPISIRVNPDVDAKTHPHISTGLREAKFGIPFGEARRIYQTAANLDHINVLGIAVHIGSQITSLAPIVNALERIIDLAEELASDGIKSSIWISAADLELSIKMSNLQISLNTVRRSERFSIGEIANSRFLLNRDAQLLPRLNNAQQS